MKPYITVYKRDEFEDLLNNVSIVVASHSTYFPSEIQKWLPGLRNYPPFLYVGASSSALQRVYPRGCLGIFYKGQLLGNTDRLPTYCSNDEVEEVGKQILALLAEAFTRELRGKEPKEDSSLDPYEVLGVTEKVSEKELKISYRVKISLFHPDAYQEYPKHIQKLILRESQTINDAYDRILRDKNYKK